MRRWDPDEIDEITAKPWEDHKPRKERERTIGPRKERQSGNPEEVPPMTEKEKEEGWSHKGPRSFRITKEDVLLHDPTDSCPGCEHAVGPEGAVRTGGHNADCRRRFAEIFRQDPARRAFVEGSERRKREKQEQERSIKRQE